MDLAVRLDPSPTCLFPTLDSHPLMSHAALVFFVTGPLATPHNRHCSGTEAAREYFPDSLLSLPRDLNAAYLERGDPIWPRENVPRPPLPEQSSTPGATAAAAAAPNSRRHTRRAAFTAAAGSAVRRKRRRPASVATAEEGRPRGRLRRLLSPW